LAREWGKGERNRHGKRDDGENESGNRKQRPRFGGERGGDYESEKDRLKGRSGQMVRREKEEKA